MKMILKCFIACCLLFIAKLTNAGDSPHVLEMDDRIIEYSKQGKWLISFYAPWCGHCRKLEPVWEQLAIHYDGKPFNIARVDATKHIKATNFFEIKAYPTIKFIYGKKNLNYNGERRKEQIIDFLTKADSPPVYRIISRIDYQHHKTIRNHFFSLIAEFNDTSETTKEYHELANKNYLNSFFYFGKPEDVSRRNAIYTRPTVGVIKESDLMLFIEPVHGDLETFVRWERFLQFEEVSLSNFHLMVDTGKILLILMVNLDDKLQDEATKELMRVCRIFTKENRTSFYTEFQFGYTENREMLNGIALWTFKTPVMFALNSTSYEYTAFDVFNDKGKPKINFVKILSDIRERKVQWYGGHSWFRSFRRPLWELYRAVIEMFTEAPIISLLIFGFPFGVISIVCYFLCCLDSTEDESAEHDDLSDDELDDDEEYNLSSGTSQSTLAPANTSIKFLDNKPNIVKETSKKTN